ncbi:hypothetical protein AAH978_09100 [Streptomyces sp. ZYX-F-203]
MTAGWCSRTVRAAVFAAVCVLLAATGHVLMSGTSVPWWAMTGGAAATAGGAWWLARRERGTLVVGSAALGAQGALHAHFSLAQVASGAGEGGEGSLFRRWLEHVLCLPAPGAPSGGTSTAEAAGMSGHDAVASHAAHAAHAMAAATDHLPGTVATAHLDHGMGGMSPTGMLAAHLLAALLSGLWLARGERAAFRILRALAGWLFAPLRPLLRSPSPPLRPRPRPGRSRPAGALCRLLLAHAITSRGPPRGPAVA